MSQIQSVIFDKQYYTLSKAKKWLQKHNMFNEVDEKPATYRFRQLDPNIFNRMRTKRLDTGIKTIIGFY